MKELIEKYQKELFLNREKKVLAISAESKHLYTGKIVILKGLIEDLESLQSKGKTKEEVKFKEVLREAFGYYSQIGETDISQKDVDDDFEEWYKEAIEEYAQSHANKDGWIPVTERLPENGQEVIAFLKKTETNWLQHSVIVKAHVLDSRATHWMPLPTPPQP